MSGQSVNGSGGDGDTAFTNGSGQSSTSANGSTQTSTDVQFGTAENGSLGAHSNGHALHSNGSAAFPGATGNGSGGSVAQGASTSAADMMDDDPTTFTPIYEGSLLDRRELIRITLQSLRELGFESSAKALETESGVTMEHASIAAFRKAILSGDWKNAERLLLDGLKYGAARLSSDRSTAPTAGSSRSTLPGASNAAGASSSSSSLNLDLVLREPQTRGLDSIKFLIYQQRYLELLEAKQTRKALSVLRDRLAPLNHGSDRLHQLSSLVICGSSQELRARANWLGSGFESRHKLLEDIESAISPMVMIPSRRLPQLLEQAQQLQRSRDSYYNLSLNTRMSLYVDHQSDRNNFPTHNVVTLSEHTDEVWHVAFSSDGTKLASASKDRLIYVWSVPSPSKLDFEILHKFGPLSGYACHVAFSPNGKKLLSTSDDGEVILWDLETGSKQECRAHGYTVGSASWLPDGQGFVTGAMDCKVIFWDADGTRKHTWSTRPFRVQALDVSSDGKYLVAISHRYLATAHASQISGVSNGSSTQQYGNSSSTQQSAWTDPTTSPGMNEEDWTLARSDGDDVTFLGGGSRVMGDERFQIHFYDVQRHEELGSIYMSEEMTSVAFSEDARHVLINQRPNESQVWDVERQSLLQRYIGHRIENYVVRSCFGGAQRSFISTGSEDGLVYIYHRKTGKLVERLRGHTRGSVNSVAWNPREQTMIASCGDDGTVRIWRPMPSSTGSTGSLNGNGVSHAATRSGLQLPFAFADHLTGNGHSTSTGSTGLPASNGHETDHVSSEIMGPSPFPWATSPRAATSPTSTSIQRRNRRQAAATASRRSASEMDSTMESSERTRARGDDEDEDEEEYGNEEDEEEDEEDDEDDDEDDDDGEEEDDEGDDVMVV